MDLVTVLNNARSPDNNIRGQAEAFLSQAIDSQYGPFLHALCTEFATEGRPEDSRQLAGLYIKNLIAAQDATIYAHKVEKWSTCDTSIKSQVKTGFLQALLSPVRSVSRTAAQVIGAYGALECPKQEWPELIPTLVSTVTSPTALPEAKAATLEALGYMCDDMTSEGISREDVNHILTAIVESMSIGAPNVVQEAGIIAMLNSLDFTAKNFEVAAERDAIMAAICGSTQSENSIIRMHAYECIAKIVELYYEFLQPYVDTIYRLTTATIGSDKAEVASQAIEFWAVLATTELEIVEAIDEGDTDLAYFRIVEQAAKPLLPLLFQALTKQSESPDDDSEGYIADVAAECIDLFARLMKDAIADDVLAFVSQNILSSNWRFKEASVVALGSILDGPSQAKMAPIVGQALNFLISSLQDPTNARVRESTGWTVSRIFAFHKNAIPNECLVPLLTALGANLEDPEEFVASKACLAVSNLAEACEEFSDQDTNLLSPYMPVLLQKLYVLANRPDTEDFNLRSEAYHAANMIIANSAMDMAPVVSMVLGETLNRLEGTFNPSVEIPERANLQSHLCSVISECIKKISESEVSRHADRIMQSLLQVFKIPAAIAHEDALLAMGYFIDKLGEPSALYLPYIKDPLIACLKNFEDYSVCTVAIGCVGDLCRALKEKIAPICDDVMNIVMEILQSQAVNRSVKPHAIGLFSDVAMAIEGHFERYAGVVFGILKQASSISVTRDDEDEIEYVNSLRTSILEAYTGIIQGLKEVGKQEIVLPSLEHITSFLLLCAQGDEVDDDMLTRMVGLIGDLRQAFGNRLNHFYSDPSIVKIIQTAMASDDERLAQLAKWAQSVIVSKK